MTHQITLLGGQLLPVYWGIKEKSPDIVHVLYTKETRELLKTLKKQFKPALFKTHQIEPYDYKGIKDLVENIIFDNDKASFQLNLTSGTKVMALACQSVFSTLDFDVFYIDQKNRVFDISKESFIQLKSKVKIETFLELSGHPSFSSRKISDYSVEDKTLAEKIFELTKTKTGINNLFKAVRQNCKNIETIRTFNHQVGTNKVNWKNNKLTIELKGQKIEGKGSKAFNIVFGGLWWELVIAEITSKWNRSIEQALGLSIQTKKNNGITKNEIDILLNTGSNLVFIECKSGYVNQSDINKIRTVKRLYGGVSSKSILICRYVPRKDLLEKCLDLGIEVFSYQVSYRKNKHKSSNLIPFNQLSDINKKLDILLNRVEIE